MIHRKDNRTNWFEPETQRSNRMGNIIRVYNYKNRRTITFSVKLLNDCNVLVEDGMKVAFIFDHKVPKISFHPLPGVPFLRLTLTGIAKSPRISHKGLVDAFVERFQLNKRCKYYDFKVRPVDHFGQLVYELILIEQECD